MTKEKLKRAKILEGKIQVLQEEIESIKEIANPTKECRLTNFEYNITIFLTTQEKAIVLPALLERKTEELKLLQEEFERL